MHGGGPVAELRRPDERGVPAARPLLDDGTARVPAGRDGVEQRDRDPRPCEPSRGHARTPAAGQRLLHQVQALKHAEACGGHVRWLAARVVGHVARAQQVPAPELRRVHAEPPGQFVHRGLDGEHGLREPVAAERAGGDGVRVDGARVDALGAAAVGGDRLLHRVEQHPGPVVAVRAGVRGDIEREAGQRAVARRAHPDGDLHRVPGGRRGELLLAGELELHGAPGAQHGEGDHVLGEHLLLAAEPAADPLGDDPDPVPLEAEDPAQFVAGEERHLGGRAQHKPSGLVEPADGGVRLERDVRRPLDGERFLVDGGRTGEPGFEVTAAPVHLGAHVARREAGMEGGRAWRKRVTGAGDRGQHLVVDGDERAGCLGRRAGPRHHRGDPLPVEADHAVEDERVVRVVVGVVVPRGGEPAGRGVGVAEHGDDAGNRKRRGGVDGPDPRVRVRRADQLHLQRRLGRQVLARRACLAGDVGRAAAASRANCLRRGVRRQVAGEAGRACHHGGSGGCRHARAD